MRLKNCRGRWDGIPHTGLSSQPSCLLGDKARSSRSCRLAPERLLLGPAIENATATRMEADSSRCPSRLCLLQNPLSRWESCHCCCVVGACRQSCCRPESCLSSSRRKKRKRRSRGQRMRRVLAEVAVLTRRGSSCSANLQVEAKRMVAVAAVAAVAIN